MSLIISHKYNLTPIFIPYSSTTYVVCYGSILVDLIFSLGDALPNSLWSFSSLASQPNCRISGLPHCHIINAVYHFEAIQRKASDLRLVSQALAF